MQNCLVLGSGRSGTSLVAGALAKAGFFMGDHLLPPTEGNPKGYFEDLEINRINEELLAPVVPNRPRILRRWFFHDRPLRKQRWLARVPVNSPISLTPQLENQIRNLIRPPYCFKDPRFSYTLPAWKPYLLKDTVFVCVFRHPAHSARSILKECQSESYLQSLSITFSQALQVWTLMYQHILEVHCQEGEWLFLHFDQVLGNEGLDRLEAFVQVSVDRSFPNLALRRSVSATPVPEEAWGVYQKLCRLAAFRDSGQFGSRMKAAANV